MISNEYFLLLAPLLISLVLIIGVTNNEGAFRLKQTNLAELLPTDTQSISSTTTIPSSTSTTSSTSSITIISSDSIVVNPIGMNSPSIQSTPIAQSPTSVGINNFLPTSTTSSGDDDDGCSCPSFISSDDCGSTSSPVLGGVDFVHYFTAFKLSDGTYNETEVGVEGNSSYSSTLNGYSFYFISEENKQIFDASPTSYIPQFGGFCSWGVAGEYCPQYPWSATCLGPSGNWAHWTIQEEKLYFFLFDEAKSKFMANTTKYMSAGATRWDDEWFPNGEEYSYFSTNCYVKSSE